MSIGADQNNATPDFFATPDFHRGAKNPQPDFSATPDFHRERRKPTTAHDGPPRPTRAQEIYTRPDQSVLSVPSVPLSSQCVTSLAQHDIEHPVEGLPGMVIFEGEEQIPEMASLAARLLRETIRSPNLLDPLNDDSPPWPIICIKIEKIKPTNRYPTYYSGVLDDLDGLDDKQKLTKAAMLAESVPFCTLAVDLTGSATKDPHEEYARTVQAIQWQQTGSVVPIVSPQDAKTKSHAAAQFAALYDLDMMETAILWERPSSTNPHDLRETVQSIEKAIGHWIRHPELLSPLE